jgi:predicted nucleic acid-binding protein
MYILDSDHMSLLERGGELGANILNHLRAIALANDATVITRNMRDFSLVPNLKFDDWSA